MPSLHALRLVVMSCVFLIFFVSGVASMARAKDGDGSAVQVNNASPPRVAKLRLAIRDLSETFDKKYPDADSYLARLAAIESRLLAGDAKASIDLERLSSEALLANPLLDFKRLLLVKRKVGKNVARDAGIPSNGSSNSRLARKRFDNEIAALSPVRPTGQLTTLRRPPKDGYVGEIDLHWDGDRLLFAESDRRHFAVWEMNPDGVRRITRTPPDVDCYDPCYLPDGGIVFGCTASYQSVPCFHGTMPACHLYRIEADGSGMRQLCFDQDMDLHPSVLNNGQVLYNRWDYTGINHVFMRQLMVMNPDGTGQRAIHGSNSWFPNALYYSRALPGTGTRLASILTGYHVPRMGQFVLLDTNEGWHEDRGIVQRISGRGDPVRPTIGDPITAPDWPKFMHPFPLSEKYFLVSCWPKGGLCGIYLADVFDNLVLLREEPGYALLEPTPKIRRPKPPVIPSRVDLARDDAVVYLHDVYSGPGLAGVPRGTVKSLRVIAYHFGYRNLAGPDKIGYGGPWEAMRILGTVPMEEDGSAMFRVPARTPIAVQPLDAEGKAVQLMRSWFAAQPGEVVSCVGCHETPAECGAVRYASAALRQPREIDPWYGPARGFDFAREVQPVIDKYCIGCHNGRDDTIADLRSEDEVKTLKSWPVGYYNRTHRDMKRHWRGAQFTPAYDALLPYVRRVGIEDDVSLLVPGEYHADTSPLVQMLRSGHHGVQLDAEAWDRLVTWIDLNAPCHGTWSDVFSPIPGKAHQRRMELRKLYGGAKVDPELIPQTREVSTEPVDPAPVPASPQVQVPGWPLDVQTASERQHNAGPTEVTIDLGDGVTMMMVRVPAEKFVLGDISGQQDERPMTCAEIDQPFWMGVCEVTNEQYRQFDTLHESGYYIKRYPKGDNGKGAPLDALRQPVVRVSWQRAMAFCHWLSARTGLNFTLPSETQWEWACRGGSAEPLHYGTPQDNFSDWENLADVSFRRAIGSQKTGGVTHFVIEGAALADKRFDDGHVVSAPVGSYRPNSWGLLDMHGNVAEWTRSTYAPDACPEDNAYRADESGRKVVRGGSFFDPPHRCRSAHRRSYAPWQRVFNVGFRVVLTSAEFDPQRHARVKLVTKSKPATMPRSGARVSIPASGEIAFTERCNGPVGAPWQCLKGRWSADNRTWQSSDGILVRGSSDWTDYSVSARVQKRNRIPCILARVRDEQNFYNLEVTGTSLDLWQRNQGKWSKLASERVSVDARNWNEIGLTVRGNRLTGSLNGKALIRITDDAHAAGAPGLRASAGSGDAVFDDIKVKQLR